MAGITLQTAESKLQTWLDAEEKLAAGQSVTLEGRTLTRANLREVGERIDFWDRRCKSLTPGGGVSVQRAVFRD